MWLIDTGAALSVLSFKVYNNSFPARVKFSLGSANFAIALPDGQQAKNYSYVVVRLGNREFQMHVIVAEVKGGAFWVWTSCYKLIHVLTLRKSSVR